ncbi:MAG: HAD-IB family hydrolase, partial [Stackebrandtia sp.]
ALERSWPMLTFKHPIPLRRRVAALRHRPVVPATAVAVSAGLVLTAALIWYSRKRRGKRG